MLGKPSVKRFSQGLADLSIVKRDVVWLTRWDTAVGEMRMLGCHAVEPRVKHADTGAADHSGDIAPGS
jgi:hypothetical protein